MNEQKSEVAQLLHQISLEYEAAARGLMGLSAGSTRHTFITARLEHIGVYHEQLASLVGEVRATQLVIELAEQHPQEKNPVLATWVIRSENRSIGNKYPANW